MTDEFRTMRERTLGKYVPAAPLLETSQTQIICLYQIATSLNEIDKTLKEINRSLNKRR